MSRKTVQITEQRRAPRPQDRRAFARLPTDRPCKIQRTSARFEQAHTINVSSGGALIEVRSPRPIAVDERLHLGVAWDGSPVLPRQALLPARVVRVSMAESGVQVVAIEYLHQAEMAVAA